MAQKLYTPALQHRSRNVYNCINLHATTFRGRKTPAVRLECNVIYLTPVDWLEHRQGKDTTQISLQCSAASIDKPAGCSVDHFAYT
jgi:hypothetical protein